MRILITIVACILLPVLAESQVIKGIKSPPPKPTSLPPPPPPPPGGTAGNQGSGTTGLRLSRIPVTGNYFLGMQRGEYDSINTISSAAIKTDKETYTVSPEPVFYMNRLFQLKLYVDSAHFSTDLSELTAFYVRKLGEPDVKQQSDTLKRYSLAVDSSMDREYRVKQLNFTWHFKHYDVILNAWLIDLTNGTWKGSYSIRYAGNAVFRSMLADMSGRDGY